MNVCIAKIIEKKEAKPNWNNQAWKSHNHWANIPYWGQQQPIGHEYDDAYDILPSYNRSMVRKNLMGVTDIGYRFTLDMSLLADEAMVHTIIDYQTDRFRHALIQLFKQEVETHEPVHSDTD